MSRKFYLQKLEEERESLKKSLAAVNIKKMFNEVKLHTKTNYLDNEASNQFDSSKLESLLNKIKVSKFKASSITEQIQELNDKIAKF